MMMSNDMLLFFNAYSEMAAGLTISGKVSIVRFVDCERRDGCRESWSKASLLLLLHYNDGVRFHVTKIIRLDVSQ